MYYKKVLHLQPDKYVQVHQENKPKDTMDIDKTVGAILLGPQYNLQDRYSFEILLTVKRLWLSHWNPLNMTEYVIERYDTFNTIGCPDELILDILMTIPFHPTTMISKIVTMAMTIIFLELPLMMSFWKKN